MSAVCATNPLSTLHSSNDCKSKLLWVTDECLSSLACLWPSCRRKYCFPLYKGIYKGKARAFKAAKGYTCDLCEMELLVAMQG